MIYMKKFEVEARAQHPTHSRSVCTATRDLRYFQTSSSSPSLFFLFIKIYFLLPMSSPSVEMKMTSATAVMSPLCRLFVRALCVLGGRLTTEENVPTCEPAQRTDRARELAKKLIGMEMQALAAAAEEKTYSTHLHFSFDSFLTSLLPSLAALPLQLFFFLCPLKRM